jgi:hypothetical protein
MGPGPERARILAGLRRLGEDASNLDIKAIVGSGGWRRLRIGTYRVCNRSAPTVSSNGELTTAYAIARIVHRRDFDAAAMAPPAPDDP